LNASLAESLQKRCSAVSIVSELRMSDRNWEQSYLTFNSELQHSLRTA
jgi:hypothetical protein